jgi:HSP20 family protein
MTTRSIVPFFGLRRNLDRMFDEFLSDFGKFELSPFNSDNLSMFKPSLDVSETDAEIKVSAELPGLDEKDIDVSLMHNVLTISGQKKAEKEDKGENYHRVERSYGSFKRSIALPSEVDADKVEAAFKNGVLTVHLPKTTETQTKRIAVKTS